MIRRHPAGHDVHSCLACTTKVGNHEICHVPPDFFALDARVSKRFRWGPVRFEEVLEVLNATNQVNVESRIYAHDRRSSVPVTGLPILPVLGLRGEY